MRASRRPARSGRSRTRQRHRRSRWRSAYAATRVATPTSGGRRAPKTDPCVALLMSPDGETAPCGMLLAKLSPPPVQWTCWRWRSVVALDADFLSSVCRLCGPSSSRLSPARASIVTFDRGACSIRRIVIFRVRLKPDTTTVTLVVEKHWRRREIRSEDARHARTLACQPKRATR